MACRIRSVGSAALAMSQVAAGRADAYAEFGVHVWDIAAGFIVLTEAGGVVMDPAGRWRESCWVVLSAGFVLSFRWRWHCCQKCDVYKWKFSSCVAR